MPRSFSDAAPEVRGMRRFDQLGAKPTVQAEEVIRELHARDERDRNRADSPLKPADDAVLLDSTNLTLDEAVKAAEEIVAAKLALKVLPQCKISRSQDQPDRLAAVLQETLRLQRLHLRPPEAV